MERSKGDVEPCRLFDAAEVLLRLAVQRSGVNGVLSYAYPAATPVLAHRLSMFSSREIEEACDFLVRIGFLEDHVPKEAGAAPPTPSATRAIHP
jgi:hypothetical protein